MQNRNKTVWIVLSALVLFLLCSACEWGCLEGDSESGESSESSESNLETSSEPTVQYDADAGIPF